MQRALELAGKGKFKVGANPMVGAVIVHQDQIIGEGYHQKFGEAHAEVNAINNVKDPALLKESTIYVNLEPCSHHGKTPPCADLIIETGIKKLVVANLDPSDKVAGKGLEKIRSAGIEVRTGILKAAGEELNKRFFSLHQRKRPFILLKWALTADGFMGRDQNDPHSEDSWISNPLSKQKAHLWRAENMSILIGKNTALIDDPELTCREVNGNHPIRFLIDPSLTVETSAKIFNKKAPTVVLNELKSEQNGRKIYLRYKDEDAAPACRREDEKTALFETLFRYCLENGIHSLMVEGGAHTLQSFIDAGFWDEARVFLGTKKFKKGVEGPNLNTKAMCKERLRDDVILFYKNPGS